MVTSGIASNRCYEENQDLRKDVTASPQCTHLHACHFTVVSSGRGSSQTLLCEAEAAAPPLEDDLPELWFIYGSWYFARFDFS